jgi:hypothetical protein
VSPEGFQDFDRNFLDYFLYWRNANLQLILATTIAHNFLRIPFLGLWHLSSMDVI